MKKIILLTIILFWAFVSNAQFINAPTRGSATMLDDYLGGIRPRLALILPPAIYADTTAANSSVASQYSGSFIQVAGGQIWYRTLNPAQWHLFLASTGSSFVLISDTSAMLSNLLRKSDTAFMLSTRLKYSDTTNQMAGYIRKGFSVLYTDTASMLSQYFKQGGNSFGIGVGMQIGTNDDEPIVFRTKGRVRLDLDQNGLLSQQPGNAWQIDSTGQAKFNNLFIYTPPNGFSTDSLLTIDQIGTGNVHNSSPHRLGLLISSDTASMLSGYAKSGQVVKYSDTTNMLSNRLKISDTSNMLSGYGRSGQIVKYSDTANEASRHFTNGILQATSFPALTGDVTTPVGSVATTLATVNGSPGIFGSASQTLSATVNAKGLVTAMSVQSIQVAESQVTNLTTDLAAKVPLSGATMTGNLILNADPTTSLGAATKNYVDNIATGLSWKPQVKAATTANIVLSGTQTVDAIALVAGDTVFVKNQTTTSQNGYYIVSAGAWTRASWGVTGAQILGSSVFVRNGGTVNGGTQWANSNTTAPTIGTDPVTFTQIAGAGVYTGGTYVTVTGNVVDVNSTYSTQWNTAFSNRITSLTTTGSSGAATLSANVLNIPNYTLAGLGGITLSSLSAGAGISYNNTTGVITNSLPMVYPGAGIPISTGTAWGASITDNSPNWNTAYSWGNWAAGSHYIGTTLIANNRASASQTLTGTSIDGNAGTSTQIFVTDNNTSGGAYSVLWGSSGSGNMSANGSSTKLLWIPSTGTLSATIFSGSGSSLTSVPTNTALYPTLNQNTTGNAATTSQTNFSNLTIGGSQVLDAANYNSYAPTLTGTGASGTWVINVTGNAATWGTGSQPYTNLAVASPVYYMTTNGAAWGYTTPAQAQANLGINTGGTLTNNITGTALGETLATVTGRGLSTGTGIKVTGFTGTFTGAGNEILYTGSAGLFQTYDRAGSVYLPTGIDGSTISLNNSGVTKFSIASGTINAYLPINAGSNSITAGAASFTTGTFSSAVTAASFASTISGGGVFTTANGGTSTIWMSVTNSGGAFYFGRENNTGTSFGATAYAGVLYSAGGYPIQFLPGGTLALTLSNGTGAATFSGRINGVVGGTAYNTAGLWLQGSSSTDGIAIGGLGGSYKTIDTYGGSLYLNMISGNGLSVGGAAIFTSSVTATSHITTGGTSSQFTKGDGSLDGNTYLTSNQSITLSGEVTGTGTTAITTTLATTIANAHTFSGIISLTSNTASSAYTNGTLVITGGLGVSGDTYMNGKITATGGLFESDIRLKNILQRTSSEGSFDMIAFKWKPELKRDKLLHYGYAAQEVEKYLPDQVQTDSKGFKSVNYIEVHTKKISDLENKIIELENRISQLEKHKK